MTCSSKCLKYILYITNGLFMMLGIVLITTACMDIDNIQGYIVRDAGHETDSVLIAIGVLFIMVAVFGCLGAWKENPKMLYIFAGLLVITILLELSVSIAAAVLRSQSEHFMKTNLRKSFIENKSIRGENNRYRNVWDRIQSHFQCCGVTGPDNYRDYDLEYTQIDIEATFSCCPPDNSDSDCLTNDAHYNEGCEDKILAAIHNAGRLVIACGIVFSFFEIIGVVLAVLLARAIRTQRNSFKCDDNNIDIKDTKN